MAETVNSPSDQALQDARWDLEPLVEGAGTEGATRQLEEAARLAEDFSARYRGAIADLDAPGLAAAMREAEDIFDRVGRAGSYASLAFAVDTQDPATGALVAQVSERGASIETSLLFFDLEWNEVSDERAEELLSGDELSFCRHHLRTLRRYRDHQLSEPEERVLTETQVTGRSAFARLFTELTSAISVDLPGSEEPVPLMEALSLMQSPDREQRAAAGQGVTAALAPGLRTRAFIFNNLLQEKSTNDRLRSYPHWLASRNLSNEASDESVNALIEAVVSRYELARRWYGLKARLLGLDKLAYYDRMAPVADFEQHVPYDRGARAGARLLPRLLRRAGRRGLGLLRRPLHRRPAAAGQARRSLLRVHGALGAPLRDAQLHLATRRRADHGPRARPRRARRALPPEGNVRVHHAPDRGRDRVDLRGDDRAGAAAGRRARRGGAAVAAGRVAGRRGGGCLPPDRHEPLRAPDPHRAALDRGAVARRVRPSVVGDPGRPAGRLGRALRGLRLVVVVCAPLRGHARLRVRLRLRPPAGAVGLPALRGGGRELHALLPRAAARRRLDAARGAGRHRGRRLWPTRGSGARAWT
ncbi:MAG: hypothetical protein WKF40_09735 [Thermoleophilaceae bacterium]